MKTHVLAKQIEEARSRGDAVLNLSQYVFNNLPQEIGDLGELVSLDMSGCSQLDELPTSIGRLAKLSRLVIAKTRLRSLPTTFGQLSQLTHLDLSHNRLRELPASIGGLANLQVLNLSGNALTTLPDSIGELSRLRWLSLADNRLSTLPDGLLRLPSLEALFLHGNAELQLPPEVLGPTAEAVETLREVPSSPVDVLEYYRRVKTGSQPLNEAKLILVGRGGVGKTSLVNRLVDGTFNPQESKTEGIRIRNWSIRLNTNERVRLNIWDFGGQEIMHATHQFFLTERSVYLVVLSGREGREEDDADYWLRLIESFGGDSPVIVVLSKIREHSSVDLNRRGLQQKFPAIRDFIRTDSAEGFGISELRAAIERETDRLEHLRAPFPREWFDIKNGLAGMKRNFLSFEEFRAFCARHAERNDAAQGTLAGHLHNLGIALNYRNDPRLQDTHVLNPHWVTNAIYKILNSEQLERQKGALSLADIPSILDETDYPVHMHRFLIDLMKKFDLCFSFPDDDPRVLIPELLDKQQPKEADEFKPAECLNFQYHYPVLPEGLLPRLIVRTHVLSTGQPRWRTGVILQFEGCRALVRADVQDRKVFISVSGPASARRQLLTVIRVDLEHIHHHIKRLQPVAMVPVPKFPDEVVEYSTLETFERDGVAMFPKAINGRSVQLNVRELLHGVEIDRVPTAATATAPVAKTLKLFCSYAHEDKDFRNQFETHLKLLKARGLLDTWYDTKIAAGDDWQQRINENLARADIIVFLVSADFLASDFCMQEEVKRALDRRAEGSARVVPIIVRDVDWSRAAFAALQALPAGGKPIKLWGDTDSAWKSVSGGLEHVIEEVRAATVGESNAVRQS